MASTNAFLVEIAGNALPDDVEPLLSSATVDDSLNLPDLFVLRFRDPDRVVLDKAGVTIGAPVRVSVLAGDEQAPALLVAGEVTAVEVDADTTGTFTVVRGYDHAHRLFRGRGTHAYTQVTASDVVTAVARRAGVALGEIAATDTVFDHVGQQGTSDWRFLSDLARRIGYEVAVRDGKLDFRPPRRAATAPGGDPDTNRLVLRLGVELLRFRAVVTAAEQVGEVQVRGWDVAQKRPLVAAVPARTDTAELAGADPATLAATFGDPVLVAGEIPYGTQAEVDVAAAALADQVAGAFAEFSGLARGNPALRADVAFTIGGLGAPFDGKYTITSSRHTYAPDAGYTTAITVSGRQDRSLHGLASRGAVAAPASGVVVGQVSDAADPQESGRVRLLLPLLSDDYVTDWARTVQPGAGADRGATVVPEVGDEVLVAFDGAGRPYVLGGLFNGVDAPARGPVDLVDGGTGSVNRRSLVSRRGHRIDLLDEDGRTEGVSITTSGDKLRVVLDAVGTAVTVHSDGTVAVEGRSGVTIDAGTGALELTGANISLKATGGVTVDGGTGPVTVTGTMIKLN